jgi:hypothetical protein
LEPYATDAGVAEYGKLQDIIIKPAKTDRDIDYIYETANRLLRDRILINVAYSKILSDLRFLAETYYSFATSRHIDYLKKVHEINERAFTDLLSIQSKQNVSNEYEVGIVSAGVILSVINFPYLVSALAFFPVLVQGGISIPP